MKYIFSITMLLLSFLAAGAQSVKNETSWTDGDATYHTEYRTMNTERGQENVIFFLGMSPHEGGFEFVLRPVPGKTGEYTLYADETDYVPLNGNVGDRVQHLQKDGINALIVRNAQGRATDVLVRDNMSIIRIWERDLTSIFAGEYRIDPTGGKQPAQDCDLWTITNETVTPGRGATETPLYYEQLWDYPQNVLRIDEHMWQLMPTVFGINVYPVRIVGEDEDFERIGEGRSMYWNNSAKGRFHFLSERLCNLPILMKFDKPTLRLMRNEIMARHGYVFSSPDLINHFSKQQWYKPGTDNAAIRLSTIEQLNVELIQALEAKEQDPENVVKTEQPIITK